MTTQWRVEDDGQRVITDGTQRIRLVPEDNIKGWSWGDCIRMQERLDLVSNGSSTPQAIRSRDYMNHAIRRRKDVLRGE